MQFVCFVQFPLTFPVFVVNEMTLSAAVTFGPSRAHTVKNKTCSHDVICKPVTTGSTPKRERGVRGKGHKVRIREREIETATGR